MKNTLFILGLMLMLTQSAHAYVGPGMGVGALGVLIGIVSTVIMAIIGLVWYPLKRAMKGDASEEELAEEFSEEVADEKEGNAVS